MDNADQDGVITPVLSDDEYRIVLTWSSTPSDLDSHLSGPLSTGERFHVYYSDMSAFDNGETVATLDLDDTSSYGPETITLKKRRMAYINMRYMIIQTAVMLPQQNCQCLERK